MRDALLRDLAQLPEVEVIVSCDARLPPPLSQQLALQIVEIAPEDDVWQAWSHCIASADAVWPIAPETDGALLRLTALVESQQKILFGSNSDAVKLAGSKYATWLALQAADINVVPTYLPENWPGNQAGHWVAKPDDGVGCAGIIYFDTTAALTDWLAQGGGTGHVIQPFMPGIPASISMLCRQRRAWLLSCNRQKVSLHGASFVYSGSLVNGMAQHWTEFDALAQRIARAIPGLCGYFGVDVLVDEGQLQVFEINPRLTTSYVGLHEAIGCNPARLVLDLLYNHASTSAGFNMLKGSTQHVADVTV